MTLNFSSSYLHLNAKITVPYRIAERNGVERLLCRFSEPARNSLELGSSMTSFPTSQGHPSRLRIVPSSISTTGKRNKNVKQESHPHKPESSEFQHLSAGHLHKKSIEEEIRFYRQAGSLVFLLSLGSHRFSGRSPGDSGKLQIQESVLKEPGLVAHAFNPSTLEAEAGRSL
ncbi:hypothetical protein LEMLEM_LOCUS3583 [Lemmus lemmus]